MNEHTLKQCDPFNLAFGLSRDVFIGERWKKKVMQN